MTRTRSTVPARRGRTGRFDGLPQRQRCGGCTGTSAAQCGIRLGGAGADCRDQRVDRHARRHGQRPDPAAGVGLSRAPHVSRRRVRQEGRRALRDRSPSVRSGAQPGDGAAGRERRRSSPKPSAISRAISRSPNSARSRRASSTTTSSARDAAKAAVASDKAAVEAAQLNLGFTRVTSLIDGVAAIATRADRRPGRTDVAPDDGLAGRIRFASTSRSASRSISTSPTRSARPPALPRCGRKGGGLTLLLADGRVVSASRLDSRGRSRGRSEDGHDPRQRLVPEPRATSCVLASTAAFGRRPPSVRTRCSCRSAP